MHASRRVHPPRHEDRYGSSRPAGDDAAKKRSRWRQGVPAPPRSALPRATAPPASPICFSTIRCGCCSRRRNRAMRHSRCWSRPRAGWSPATTSRSASTPSPAASLMSPRRPREKIYRSTGATTEISQVLSVASDAWLEYLPPETILFDGARLHRHIVVVDVAGCWFPRRRHPRLRAARSRRTLDPRSVARSARVPTRRQARLGRCPASRRRSSGDHRRPGLFRRCRGVRDVGPGTTGGRSRQIHRRRPRGTTALGSARAARRGDAGRRAPRRPLAGGQPNAAAPRFCRSRLPSARRRFRIAGAVAASLARLMLGEFA